MRVESCGARCVLYLSVDVPDMWCTMRVMRESLCVVHDACYGRVDVWCTMRVMRVESMCGARCNMARLAESFRRADVALSRVCSRICFIFIAYREVIFFMCM